MSKKKIFSAKIPITSHVPDIKRSVTGRLKDSIDWAFSFKYFNQTEHFGLDSIKGSWAVLLLERLRDLCAQNREDFFRNAVKRQDYRYHAIDWNAKRIPVSRDFFNWLPQDIIDNEEEFPFLQFHISKALGRVVGSGKCGQVKMTNLASHF